MVHVFEMVMFSVFKRKFMPGAKVCRGGCGIAIFGVYRDKSRYLTFAATDSSFSAICRDFCGFPRQIAIS